MKHPLFRLALLTTALHAALPCLAQTGQPGDGSSSTLNDQAISGVSPGATPETIAAYKLITSRTTLTSSNMLHGQHLGGPNDLGGAPPCGNNPTKCADVFDMQTYRIPSAARPGLNAYPRLVGARYDNNAVSDAAGATLDSASIGQINGRLQSIVNTYHPLLAITATPLNPWDTSRHLDRQPLSGGADGPLSDLAYKNRSKSQHENTAVDRFWNDIDTIADGLAALKDSNGRPIPVLFRPFAEINTDKYYFKGQSPRDFVALWGDVVAYYRDTRHLHNLIYCWEAWTWGSSSTASPQQTHLDAWFPPANQVDVVGGAFYFTADNIKDGYFSLQFNGSNQQNTDDQAIFNDLMGLAVNNNKPFGATQWAVNQGFDPGDNLNTLQFMKSLDARHKKTPSAYQHMAFDYYWTTDQEANWQQNPGQMVDDPRVATVSSLDGVAADEGTITESAAKPGTGGALSSTPQTGFSGTKQQYRAVLSFATNILPPGAIVDSTNALTLLLSRVTDPAVNPYDVAGQVQWVDAGWVGGGPAVFGNSELLESIDFNAAGQAHVGQLSDWRANPVTSRAPAPFSAASVPSNYFNTNGPTQLRAYFTAPKAGAQVTWNNIPVTGINKTSDDLAPQLIFTYTLP